MSRFDPYLRNYVESKGGDSLRTEIAAVWQSISGTKLYSGGPRASQTDSAIARSIAALKVASATNDRMLLAEACRLMAHTLNADEQYEESLAYYQKAIALFESSGAGEQAARTRLGFTAASFMLGKYDQALEIAAVAERWFKANNHLSGLAKVYTNLGNLNYRREQHQAGLAYHSKARILFQQLNDSAALAMCYLNIANGLAFTNQLRDAHRLYDVSEQLSSQLKMQELFIQSRYNKCYLIFLEGDFVESIEGFKSVREHFVQTGSRHHVHLCDLDVAEVYLHRMKPDEALSFAERAAAGFAQNGMRYEHSKAKTFAAMALAQVGRFNDAEKAALAARAMFEAEANRFWTSIVDFCLAYVCLSCGDVPKARMLATQAKNRLLELGIEGGAGDSLSRLETIALEFTRIKTSSSCMTEIMRLAINKRR